jgi:hypothetical protein
VGAAFLLSWSFYVVNLPQQHIDNPVTQA